MPRQRIVAWVADLDAEDFSRRFDAERHLGDAGDQAEQALNEVVRRASSLEAVRRAERLLARIANQASDPERLRQLRAVEILERLGSRDAIALLQRLAAGAPGATLTREASESLKRLTR